MGLTTNLNQSPYYDDFNESKDFHRILFKPAVAVQARELNQLQTILQKQIERFGDNILKEGTIISGCNFQYLKNLEFVKIRDLQVNEQPVVMSNYEGLFAVGVSSGVEAYVIKTSVGLEAQTPNLNTLHVRYTRSGNTRAQFDPNENIELRNDDGEVLYTVIAAGAVAGESSSTVIGKGVGLKVSDGVIYQKGNFIRVDEQTVVISKYYIDFRVNNIAVGFVTVESIVTSRGDTDLLDNAEGFNNVNAPGADRLKLKPVLTVKSVAEARADSTFFTLVEYQLGNPVRKNDTTQYAAIGDEMAKRTAEESGDYVLEPFRLSVEYNPNVSGNTNALAVRVGAGHAYVDGKRIKTHGPIDINVDAGIDFASVTQQRLSTDYGNYVVVDEYLGDMGFDDFGQVDLYNAAQNRTVSKIDAPDGTLVGTAKVRSVQYKNGTVGANTAQYEIYLFDIQMANTSLTFRDDVKSIVANTSYSTGGIADIVLDNSDKARIFDSNKKKLFFPIGVKALKTTSNLDFIYKTKLTATLSSGTTSITFTVPSGDSWILNALDGGWSDPFKRQELLLMPKANGNGYNKGIPVNLDDATVNTQSNTNDLVIGGLADPGSNLEFELYVNVINSNVSATTKTSKDVYIGIEANTNPGGTSGSYSLGLPDIYKLEGVWRTANGTYTSSGDDLTQHFTLFTNQRDGFYDLSYVKSDGVPTIATDDVLLFKVKVFESAALFTGYYSVNSYSNIDNKDIPVYTAEDRTTYDLRNVLDFRQYVDKDSSVSYVTDEGSADSNLATTSIGQTPVFSGNIFPLAPYQFTDLNYEYYLSRIDRLVLDSSGRFYVLRGVPEVKPSAPPKPARGMSLGTVIVPPYPSLTSFDANRAKKPFHATKVNPDSLYRGYTMADIGKIDRRLRQIEYYTVLNALETSAKDKLITDANGNDRFKNGIFTDTFEDLSLADVSTTAFKAAIDPTRKELTPRIRSFDVDLKVNSSSNVRNYNDISCLENNDFPIIVQPYSTRGRNAVSDFYKFSAKLYISPEYDMGYDETRAPDYNLDIDLATPFIDFTETMNNSVPMSQVSSTTSIDQKRSTNELGQEGVLATATTTTTTTVSTIQAGLGDVNKEKVGDYVTDVRFNPYMRQRDISIVGVGFRPNVELHFFFDGKLVDEHIAPGSVLADSDEYEPKNVLRSGNYNTTIKSDSNGEIRCVFKVPAETFFVGDRQLLIMDLTEYDERTNAVTSGNISYSAFNYSVDKTTFNVTTRKPQISSITSTSQNVSVSSSFQTDPPPIQITNVTNEIFNITNNEFITNVTNVTENTFVTNEITQINNNITQVTQVASGGNVESDGESGGEDGDSGDDGGDPIAQTFLIHPRMAQTDTILYASKMDLYFEQKSNTAGFTLFIREVNNTGYISNTEVPFSKTHVAASDVVVSADASEATTVTFRAPVPLKVGSEYAFVVKPDGDNPDYRLWIAKTGEVDVTQQIPITQDVNDGTLFTSTNDRTWTPHQDENIKYSLYRSNFTKNTGTINFTNKNSEYFTISNINGTFRRDELVFANAASVSAQTVNVTLGSNEIVGTDTTFSSTFTSGDYIIVRSGSNYDVLKVLTTPTATSMTVSGFAKFSNTSAQYFKAPVGRVTLFDTLYPPRLHLDESSAKTGNLFAAANVLVGSESGAYCTIDSVDNRKVSFIAPEFYRTNTTLTSTYLNGKFWSSGANYYSKGNIPFNNHSFFDIKPTYIKSRSNEIADSDSDRSFSLDMYLMNTGLRNILYSSPMVDTDIASVKVFEYMINNVYTNEDLFGGNADSKYISKTITLQEGLEAEDLKVFLTAYKPKNTNIKVYAKFLSTDDGESLEDKVWTELDILDGNITSSLTNNEDYKELEFNLPTIAPSDQLPARNDYSAWINAGAFEYNNGVSSFSDYRYWKLKIVLLSVDHAVVPKVADIRAISLSI